ncbi:MAG: hypothetical protein CBD18_05090 [Opitutales bacterium TMED158]|nr:MAG: hypothetical protein CBD18_05090 [Opitutales bacterium TMED158]
MAKGRETHRERLRQLSLFGKDLTRRSRSRCELCGSSGERLSIYEIAPVPKAPEFDRCLFLCAGCREPLDGKGSLAPERWRFLSEAIWSEVPAVQVMAARVLDALSRKERWAVDALEEACLEDEIVERVKEQPL